LATRLRELVAQDILKLVPAADGTAYQAYALTRKGRDLFAVIVALRQWGETYLFDEGEPHSVLLDNSNQLPVRLHVTDAEDRPLTADGAFVRKVASS
jgi:hypothetical protein